MLNKYDNKPLELPADFISYLKGIPGLDAEALISALEEKPVIGVRINKRKAGASFTEAKKVKWCESGLILPERPKFTLDPLLHAGAYYVQEPSSMIYETLAKQITDMLLSDYSSDISLSLLDMCAAPGGKTTAMINGVPDGTKIIANEYVAKRIAPLKENLSRWGYRDVTVTNHDSGWFKNSNAEFDIVAVDAPCSGEGMMRKESAATLQWSYKLVEDCSKLQRQILDNAASCVKEGGFLIYSTCTFNLKENEENAQYIVDKLGFLPYEPAFPDEWGIHRGLSTQLPVYRFMPHITPGEGLFLSVFRKPGNWCPDIKKKIQKNKILNIKKDQPLDIDDILAVDYDRSLYPQAELTGQQALAFLRGESIVLPSEIDKGIVTVTFSDLPLGQVKNIGTRANNLFPKNRRILMR